MARTLNEILEHADELAARFETGEFEMSEAVLAEHRHRVERIRSDEPGTQR